MTHQLFDEDGEILDKNNSEKNFERILQDIYDDYDVEKMNSSLLDIAITVIDVKRLFNELGVINP